MWNTETKTKTFNMSYVIRCFCFIGNICKTMKSWNKDRVRTLCGRYVKNNVESFSSVQCYYTFAVRILQKFGWYTPVQWTCNLLDYIKLFNEFHRELALGIYLKFSSLLWRRKSENEIELMIGIIGAKECPEKIKQVTSVYV